jgi:hypothetical protein
VLTLLLVVAGLTAQQPPAPTVRKEEDQNAVPNPHTAAKPELAVAAEQTEIRRAFLQRLADLDEKGAALRQAKNELTNDYKVKLAELEADHKTKLARLDQSIQRMSSAAEQLQREYGRSAEASHQQALIGAKPPGHAREDAPPTRRGDANTGQLSLAGQADGNAKPSVEHKLDQMMKKLEQMEIRMTQLEGRLRGR